MKHLIATALALSLIGGAAVAQDRDRDQKHGRLQSHQTGPRGPAPAAPQGGPQRFGAVPHGEARGFVDRGRPGQGPGRSGGFRGPESGFRPGFFLRDHDWRGARFHAPIFRYPPGWGYRRWAFGAFLPGVFLGPSFIIGPYWVYGLPAPPPGYHWIRIGPDALLVRYGDGYVLDAAYGVFY